MIQRIPVRESNGAGLPRALQYTVYLGEVTVPRPRMPYILVKLPAVNMGSGEALDGRLRELSYLQPLTVVAATADRPHGP